MSRIDSLKEAKRGIGVTCRCGESARITARGKTLCYECFDQVLDGYANQRMRERVGEFVLEDREAGVLSVDAQEEIAASARRELAWS